MSTTGKALQARPATPPLLSWASGTPWVLACAALATTLDLVFAIAWWTPLGVAPIRIPQSIASWVLGREAAMAGGIGTATFGVVLHYAVMALIAATYFALGHRIARLHRQPLRWGALYGVVVFAIQYLIVVPYFSAAAPTPIHVAWMLACLSVYALLVGIPCALFLRAFVDRRPGAS